MTDTESKKHVSLPKKLAKWALWSVLCAVVTAVFIQLTLHSLSPMSSVASLVRGWVENLKLYTLMVRIVVYLSAYFLWKHIPIFVPKYRGEYYDAFLASRNPFFVYLILFEIFVLSNVLQYL